MQQVVHYFLHLIFPVFIAIAFYRKQWKKTYVLLLLTMLVDLDHLLATPVFQACRCSIQFHPLHTYYAMMIYVLMLFKKQTRVIAIGLLFHMITDGIDCWMSSINCK